MEANEWESVLQHAADAVRAWGGARPAKRAAALERVADTLDRHADELLGIAAWEVRLPEDRLRAELRRTTFQLRECAREVASGHCLELVVDHADRHWPSGPRPDLRRTMVPLGPVVVFGASAFPFSASVAGRDTASALAAGCSVVFKAHPAHPDLSDRTAELVRQALLEAGAPKGVFDVVHDERSGRELLLDPRVKAVAFTGSASVGKQLLALAVSREDPIPFFGGFGGINPVFVTRCAAARRGTEIARGFVEALTAEGGQLCTKPGALVVPSTSVLTAVAADAARHHRGAPLFNLRFAERYEREVAVLREHPDVTTLVAGEPTTEGHPPTLLRTTAAAVVRSPDLLAECFGPVGLVVHYDTEDELLAVARALPGQLTAAVQGENCDEVLEDLLPELVERSGRVVWNDWPNELAVTPAMQHGGPYPASTAPQRTALGRGAIARFQRPVAFQGFPRHLLPEGLREENPLNLPRLVDL